MKRFFLLFFVLSLGLCLDAQNYSFTWKKYSMNGSRTGVKSSNTANIPQTMGRVRCHKFYAPNGRIFRGGSIPKVAKIMLDVQPAMADVKTVIAYSTRDMNKFYPESELSNWFIDNLMDICSRKTGKKVDVGIANFGGIRLNMPAGDIFKDDILSMFPFKNSLVYVALKGKDLRYILEYMSSAGFQPLGGVRCVAQGGKLVSATIAGEPIDDEKVYGVATITFLLDGGDNLFVGKNALEKIEVDGYLYDLMLEFVRNLKSENKPIEYKLDGRVKILSKDGEVLPLVAI